MPKLLNSEACVSRTDFITAFGQLLRDGPLRDAFRREPQRALDLLDLEPSGRTALLAVNPADLEFQAEVLLRKRFESVSRVVPLTITNAGQRAWGWFAEYGRTCWPTGENPGFEDARGFCSYLDGKSPSSVCASERNCLRFAAGTALVAIHMVPDLLLRNRRRHGLQIFLRRSDARWREIRLLFWL
jgi:hypothetical protein